jgi:hypothetical protein
MSNPSQASKDLLKVLASSRPLSVIDVFDLVLAHVSRRNAAKEHDVDHLVGPRLELWNVEERNHSGEECQAAKNETNFTTKVLDECEPLFKSLQRNPELTPASGLTMYGTAKNIMMPKRACVAVASAVVLARRAREDTSPKRTNAMAPMVRK